MTLAPESAVEFARAFLLEALAQGPQPARQILDDARRRGVSERSLRRAKREAALVSLRRGGLADKGSWLWALPGSQVEPASRKRTPLGSGTGYRTGCLYCSPWWVNAPTLEGAKGAYEAHVAEAHPGEPAYPPRPTRPEPSKPKPQPRFKPVDESRAGRGAGWRADDVADPHSGLFSKGRMAA